MHETAEDQHNRELAQSKLSHAGRKYFKFIEFDAKEQLVTEIRKHPFGLLLTVLIGAAITLVLLGLAIAITSIDLNDTLGQGNPNSFKGIFILLCLVLCVGSVIATCIAAYLYTSNVIYVTNEKIAQVVYTSLFNKKISQLSIGDVQDVTVTQKGIFAHLFNYGTLVIETSGEQQNYTFSYVPKPYQEAKMIVGSHEQNLVEHGN